MQRFFWCTLGVFLIFTGNLAAQKIQSDLIAKVDSINNIPFIFLTSNPSVAEPLFLANTNLADSIGYILGEAKSNAQLGIIYNYLGKQDLRTQHILKAVKLYEKIDSTRLAGFQYTELGYGLKRRDLKLAESYMMQGITMLNEFPGSITQADAFNNYSIVKLMKEEFDSALYYATRSLEIKEKEQDYLGVSYSLGNLSEIYLGMDQYDEAIQRLNESYLIRKELNDSTAMGFDLLNLGLAYNKKSEIPKAISYFKQALEIALKTEYTGLAERNFYEMTQNYEEIGRYDSALYFHKKYTIYKDSLLNIASNSKVSELQIQFETEKKEKELAQRNEELSEEKLRVERRSQLIYSLGGLLGFGFLASYLIIKQQNEKRRNLEKESKLKLDLSKKESENNLLEEKERISRDLHDNVGSQITNLITGIEISNMHIRQGQQEQAGELLKNLDEDARNTMTDLRETIWLLDKEEVRYQDFENHLRAYIQRQKRYLKDLDVRIGSRIKENFILDPSRSLNLMRIIQEALNNAKKYAEATEVLILLQSIDDCIEIVIKDNGKGMDLDQEWNKGNGLKNMHSRAKEMDAELDIISSIQNGTEIRLSFILDKP